MSLIVVGPGVAPIIHCRAAVADFIVGMHDARSMARRDGWAEWKRESVEEHQGPHQAKASLSGSTGCARSILA